MKSKTSYANGQKNLGHKHKAPHHNHEATQPKVELPTHKLRLEFLLIHVNRITQPFTHSG